jgi:hypothetical protein
MRQDRPSRARGVPGRRGPTAQDRGLRPGCRPASDGIMSRQRGILDKDRSLFMSSARADIESRKEIIEKYVQAGANEAEAERLNSSVERSGSWSKRCQSSGCKPPSTRPSSKRLWSRDPIATRPRGRHSHARLAHGQARRRSERVGCQARCRALRHFLEGTQGMADAERRSAPRACTDRERSDACR